MIVVGVTHDTPRRRPEAMQYSLDVKIFEVVF